MRYRQPFTLFQKKLQSGTKIWYYSIYDQNNVRRQYSTGAKTKNQALKYCLEKFKNNSLPVPETYNVFASAFPPSSLNNQQTNTNITFNQDKKEALC
ncbi:MAG: hypothetical protein ACRC4W_03840 [Treponemataceae bacterium]